MVDRATRYQNAMNQIQERNKNTQSQAVDVPDNTYERHAKAVRPFIAYLCPVPQRNYLCPFPSRRCPNPLRLVRPRSNFGSMTNMGAENQILKFCETTSYTKVD